MPLRLFFMLLELVVAHYQEDLRWLRKVPKSVQVTVYDKDSEHRHPGAQLLPNQGREAATYLHHLVLRYASLADVTVFCQGRPFDHAYDFHTTLKKLAELSTQATRQTSFTWLGHAIDTDTRDGQLFAQWSKNPDGGGLDFEKFCRALWQTEAPETFSFYLGGQFVVSAAQVRLRPLAYYQAALQVALDFPEAAHCFERAWDQVFGAPGVPPVWRGTTTFLKPIKRLAQSDSTGS